MVEESMILIFRQVAIILACTECFVGRLVAVKVQAKRLVQQALNTITNETFSELIQQILEKEAYARRIIKIIANQERKRTSRTLQRKQ